MKKYKIFILTIIFILNFSLTVFAEETFLNINVKGNLKKGSEIDIIINVENIQRLYAGDIRFNFDKESMELLSFKSGNFINNKDINKLEFGGNIDKSKSNLTYQFTCTGKVQGFSGSGELAIIKAKLLKDIKSSFIDKDKLKIQLCDRNEKGNIDFINYKVKNNKNLYKTTNEVDEDKPSNETVLDKIKQIFKLKNEKQKNQKENKLSKHIKIHESSTHKVNMETKDKEEKNTDYKSEDHIKKQDTSVKKDKTDKKTNLGLYNHREEANNNKQHNKLEVKNKKVNKNNKINKSIAVVLIFIFITLMFMYHKKKRK